VNSTAATDGALIARAQAGERAAMEELLRTHRPRLAAVCRRMCANAHDAEDATQEALISIVRGLQRFDGRSSFVTWSHRVATNACLDGLRYSARRPATSLDRALDPHRTSTINEPSVASRDEATSARIDMAAALHQLPEDFRLVVVLRDVGDLDYQEISDRLGIPIGTVKSRIARGRSLLAGIIGNKPDPQRRQTPLQDNDQ
jgi:RNA polymerase sigma-70 factor, ECF subfamily